MADKVIYTPIVLNPSVDLNYWLKRLDTSIFKQPYHNIIKVPKVCKPKNKNILGTNLIYNPESPLL